MQDIHEAQTCLEQNFAPWVLALQPRVIEIGADGATLDIPVTDDIARIGGMVCGQALAALADTAMVFACAGALGAFTPVATTNLETRFLRAAKGDTIRCAARILKPGRSLLFAEALLTALPEGKLVCAASATYLVP